MLIGKRVWGTWAFSVLPTFLKLFKQKSSQVWNMVCDSKKNLSLRVIKYMALLLFYKCQICCLMEGWWRWGTPFSGTLWPVITFTWEALDLCREGSRLPEGNSFLQLRWRSWSCLPCPALNPIPKVKWFCIQIIQETPASIFSTFKKLLSKTCSSFQLLPNYKDLLVTLAWKIPWTEEPGRLQSTGSQRVRHDWATSLSLFTFMHWRRKWQPTPAFLPGESQGQRRLPSTGSHRVGHDWSDLAE